MMDANDIQVRIGELCHQFRLPTMGAQSVSSRAVRICHGAPQRGRLCGKLGELSDGSFVDRGVNVLAFGLPGTGKCPATGFDLERDLSAAWSPGYGRGPSDRALGITSNLVFSQWEHIFANPMATAAAIDRVVHSSWNSTCPATAPEWPSSAARNRG